MDGYQFTPEPSDSRSESFDPEADFYLPHEKDYFGGEGPVFILSSARMPDTLGSVYALLRKLTKNGLILTKLQRHALTEALRNGLIDITEIKALLESGNLEIKDLLAGKHPTFMLDSCVGSIPASISITCLPDGTLYCIDRWVEISPLDEVQKAILKWPTSVNITSKSHLKEVLDQTVGLVADICSINLEGSMDSIKAAKITSFSKKAGWMTLEHESLSTDVEVSIGLEAGYFYFNLTTYFAVKQEEI